MRIEGFSATTMICIFKYSVRICQFEMKYGYQISILLTNEHTAKQTETNIFLVRNNIRNVDGESPEEINSVGSTAYV